MKILNITITFFVFLILINSSLAKCRKTGKKCDQVFHCCKKLYCSNFIGGRCREKEGIGATCKGNKWCKSGQCHLGGCKNWRGSRKNGKCVQKGSCGARGTLCTDDQHLKCCNGLVCRRGSGGPRLKDILNACNKTCKDPKCRKKDGFCGIGLIKCCKNLFCSFFHCINKYRNGEGCSAHTNCKSGFCKRYGCDFPGKCADGKMCALVGARCKTDSKVNHEKCCKGFVCVNGFPLRDCNKICVPI